MGIKEELLVSIMDIKKSLDNITNELRQIRTSENKNQAAIKKVLTSKTAEVPENNNTETIKEIFSEYLFGAKGENGGD